MMTKQRLQRIKDEAISSGNQADRILDGDDNYDGADGAREVRDLCSMIIELLEALDRGELPPMT